MRICPLCSLFLVPLPFQEALVSPVPVSLCCSSGFLPVTLGHFFPGWNLYPCLLSTVISQALSQVQVSVWSVSLPDNIFSPSPMTLKPVPLARPSFIHSFTSSGSWGIPRHLTRTLSSKPWEEGTFQT